jgi:acetone carboxylase, gamma subunit
MGGQKMSEQTIVTKRALEDMMDGKLPWPDVHRIMSSFKDPDRFDKYVEILQSRVPWEEPIILPLTPHLYIVKKGNEYLVKCDCGHEFCDYRKNWKTKALIYVRDSEDSLEEIWRGPRKPDPNKNEIREFYCPGCGTQLEVDAVPPGYPILMNFLPDLETFYREWLGRPLP